MTHTEREPHDLDLFTDDQLSVKALEAYEKVMLFYRVIEANGMYGEATGDKAMRAAMQQAAELHSAICVELGRRMIEGAELHLAAEAGTDG